MSKPTNYRCFACNKVLSSLPYVADTRDGRFVLVGTECYRRISAAGEAGYQPKHQTSKLYSLRRGLSQEELAAVNRQAREIS